MLEKTTLEWFGNDVEPENGSMVLVNTNVVNAFEEAGEDDDFEIETKSFPAMVYGDGRGGVVLLTWNGDDDVSIPLKWVRKWAYLPAFDKDC